MTINLKRTTPATCQILLVLLIAIPGALTYEAGRQEQLNHALISAIKQDDSPAVLRQLRLGADANCRDFSSDRRSAWYVLLDRFRGQRGTNMVAPIALIVALSIEAPSSYLGILELSPPIQFRDTPRIVEALLDYGANCQTRSASGVSVSLLAGERREYRSMRFLITHATDYSGTDRYGRTLLHHAAIDGDPATVDALLRHGLEVDARDYNGETALLYAARQGDIEIVTLLLKHGASKDVRDRDGGIPLTYAAGSGNMACVKLLLRKCVDINTVDNGRGGTPLMYAVDSGSLPIVKLLLARGADPNIPLAPGYVGSTRLKTLLSFAAERQQDEIVAALKRSGAR